MVSVVREVEWGDTYIHQVLCGRTRPTRFSRWSRRYLAILERRNAVPIFARVPGLVCKNGLEPHALALLPIVDARPIV